MPHAVEVQDPNLPPPPPGNGNGNVNVVNSVQVEEMSEEDHAVRDQAIDTLEATQGVQILAMMLEKIRAPMLEGGFFADEDLASIMYETSSRSAVSKKVLETLWRCQTEWSAEEVGKWEDLTGADRERFLEVLVKDDGGARLDLLSSDLNKLGKLPLFETLSGEYVSLGENSSGGQTVNENYTLGSDLSLDGEGENRG